jgi:hypothetical protein
LLRWLDVERTTVKALASDYSFDGPHKIDNKEGRMLEAFFVSRHP